MKNLKIEKEVFKESKMDLNSAQVSDDEKLKMCKYYFYGGFALLPFLWAINVVWFFKEAFIRKPEFPQQKDLKQFVMWSAVLSAICLAGLITWISIFTSHRASWGLLGDQLSFNIPTGSP